MPFSSEDVKASEFLDPFAEDNVRATPSHVGGYDYIPFLARHGHNFSLPLVILGI
jgi:hypothetical protein